MEQLRELCKPIQSNLTPYVRQFFLPDITDDKTDKTDTSVNGTVQFGGSSMHCRGDPIVTENRFTVLQKSDSVT